MIKPYAMMLILTLGAPLAAAELTALQLPLIDAAAVRSQLTDIVMVPASNKAAMDITLVRPMLVARMQANLLRTVAVTLRGLEQQNSPEKAPAEYTSGVEYASELVEEALLNMNLAIADKDQAMLHTETLRLEPVIAKLAALSKSVENHTNYKSWGGAAIKNIAAELDRNVREIRINAPFAF